MEPSSKDWEPTRWWRAIGPDGELWSESSDEEEVREDARPGDRVQRLYEYRVVEWRDQQEAALDTRIKDVGDRQHWH